MKKNGSVLITRPNKSPVSIRFSNRGFRGFWVGVGLAILLLILSVGGNIYWFMNHATIQHSADHLKEQEQVIQQLTHDIQALKTLMEELIQKENDLREDLGRPKYRRLSYHRQLQDVLRRFRAGYPSIENGPVFHVLASQLHVLKDRLLTIEKSMRTHENVFDQYVAWFKETPSIWPVYGYVRSGYGWRMHPLRGSRQFHKGIDIPAWIGAPVQATADGYVEFSGWGGGYGWMVVVSHAYGIRTIYAHLSDLEVPKGIRVKKGQIIGKIGTSGLSTGPHVHYEIRDRQRSLEPSKYLDLDLFTAVSTLW